MKDFGNNRNRNLIYLQGYLQALAAINTYTNHSKTYSIDILKKVNHSIEDTLRAHWGVKHWKFETLAVDAPWQTAFAAAVQPYFVEIIHQAIEVAAPDAAEAAVAKFRQYGFLREEYIVRHLVDTLEKIVGKEACMIQVDVQWNVNGFPYEGFFEQYAADFVFDLGKTILYLHFGDCD